MTQLFDETGRRYQRHGRAYDPAIKVWQAMIGRCTNPSDCNYRNWGGRGIKVCDRWLDANDFCDWAHANGYQRGLTIERIDNDGDYCPENCCWVTKGAQARNRRTTHWIIVRGRKMTLTDAEREFGVIRQTILHRLNRGWSAERAVSESPAQ